MIPRFARPVSQFCMISNHMNLLFTQWDHLLTNLNQGWLDTLHLEMFAAAIHAKGAPLKNYWGFIDGILRAISCPREHQRILYNGHKRCHGIKFQSLVAPNDLIANLYGPVEGKRHDSGMLTDSNLLNNLAVYSFNSNREPNYVYGYPAYPIEFIYNVNLKELTYPLSSLFRTKI